MPRLRLDADGTLDAGFGVAGKKVCDFAQTTPSYQNFGSVAAQGSNVIFVGYLNSVDTTHTDRVVAPVLDELIFADGFE